MACSAWAHIARTAWSLARGLARPLLPYPDPARRRRVRTAARSLVRCAPWPGDAATGADVAELALLRLLWLQRVCRRAAWQRNNEPTVLVARSAVEVCILGLYCLDHDTEVASLRAASMVSLGQVMQYVVDAGLVPQDLVDQSVALLGPKGRRTPVKSMVDALAAVPRTAAALTLYRRFYVPTSDFFVHANAASLLRHVQSDNALSDRPLFPWTRRSALHVVDACVSILGAAIAAHSSLPVSMFDAYTNAHLSRAYTLVAVVGGHGLRRTVQLGALPGVVRAAVDVRRYSESEQAKADPPEVRAERLRAALAQVTSPLIDSELPDELRQLWQDWIVETVLADIARLAGEDTDHAE